MFEALELLRSSTNGIVDIYNHPLLLQMALYMPRTQIVGDFYINQGDASSIVHPDADRLFRMGKRLRSPDIVSYAIATIQPDYVPSTLPALFDEADLLKAPAAPPPVYRDTWLPDTRIMAARKRAGSTEGLYLACIASDNGKSHSHNDAGSFWVYSNGLPMLIDLGQESYQKKSFDAHRYEIPTTQSSWHNLPTIGETRTGTAATQTGPADAQVAPGVGIDEGVGPQFRATDVRYKTDETMAELSMELCHAYPASANLTSWRRTVRLVRTADRVEIIDKYSQGQAKPVTLNFITTCSVRETSPGRLTIANPAFGKVIAPASARTPPLQIIFDSNLLSFSVETMKLENTELVRNWGERAYRIRLTAKPATDQTLSIVITT